MEWWQCRVISNLFTMKHSARIVLFLMTLLAGVVSIGVVLDLIPIDRAQEVALRIGGVIAIAYLVVLVGALLFATKKN